MRKMNENERQLLKMARNGVIGHLKIWTAPHQRIVYNYLLIGCEDEFEASRLTQDVFVRVFELLASDAVGDDLFTCIYRTAMEIRRQHAGTSKMIS